MKTIATIFVYSYDGGEKSNTITIDPTMNKEELIYTAMKMRETLNTLDVLIANHNKPAEYIGVPDCLLDPTYNEPR